MFDVSCVGILTADVLAKPIDALPPRGLLSKTEQIQLFLGGCASNAAIDLAKLGASVQIFGKVGQDSFGQFVKNEVARWGVNVDGLKESRTAQTSASVVAVGSDGERSVMHCFGANAEFNIDDIDFEQVKKGKILFIAGTFLMSSFDGAGACQLLQKAKEAGMLCCLDTAWDPTGRWMDVLGSCLPWLDWFMPSYEEAVQLSGKTQAPEMAEVFTALGAKNIIIKLGDEGCYVLPQGREGFYAPAYKDVAVVDTSGAGDSFCAGFLMGLSQQWPVEQCVKFANAVGSHCVMSMGTTTGIKSMEEILDFIKQKEG